MGYGNEYPNILHAHTLHCSQGPSQTEVKWELIEGITNNQFPPAAVAGAQLQAAANLISIQMHISRFMAHVTNHQGVICRATIVVVETRDTHNL